MNARFIKQAISACENALVTRSFRRVEAGILVRPVTDTFLGWIGLNTGNYPDNLLINPFVGIHCIPVMRIFRELKGKPYKKPSTATFAVHLGQVRGDIEVVRLRSEADIVSNAERLASALEKYAIPFFEAHASYDALLPILMKRSPMLGGYPEMVACALHLMGRHSDARQFIDERLKEYAESNKQVFDNFKSFADAFVLRFSRPADE